ncbi:MAG: hypothetical protein HDR88_07310 [Bacteroides sp.]|nr:hypothetical protein [Bacteroides sp.]
MTEEQKEILIAKMLDAPSSLSDEELDIILGDGELRDIYSMSSIVKGAYVQQPDIDIEDEWERFRPRVKRKPMQMRWVKRVAIIFWIVAFASGIMVRLIDSIFDSDTQPVIAKVEQFSEIENLLPAQEEIDHSKVEERNITSTPSVKQVAVSKSKPTKSEISKSESVLKTDDIDIDEYLRIQQARIDNEIALQTAEIYKDGLNNIIPLLDAIGEEDRDMDNAIRKVIMQ